MVNMILDPELGAEWKARAEFYTAAFMSNAPQNLKRLHLSLNCQSLQQQSIKVLVCKVVCELKSGAQLEYQTVNDDGHLAITDALARARRNLIRAKFPLIQ